MYLCLIQRSLFGRSIKPLVERGETPITAEPQGKATKEIKALAKEIEVQLNL